MQIVPATLAHAEQLSRTLREADLRELREVEPDAQPKAIIAWSLGVSTSAFTAVLNDRVVCMGGVAPRGDGSGSVWLLGTDLMVSHKVALGRVSPPCVDLMHKEYRIIHNHADSRNHVHLRWLRWLGFKELPSVTDFVKSGVPFIPFYHIKD